MLKLHLPEIMHHLEKKELILTPPNFDPMIVDSRSKSRQKLVSHIMPLLHTSQKFIFDSGSDQDLETVTAVRETATNMMEAGFFHLPYPVTWIEDPFEEGDYQFKFEDMRNYYLCHETAGELRIYAIQRMPEVDAMGMRVPRYSLHLAPLIIKPSEATDHFTVLGVDQAPPPHMQKTFGEFVYAVKKFIVTLGCAQVDREKVLGTPFKASLPKQHRKYEFSIVRVPYDRAPAEPREGGRGHGTVAGMPRRKLLVRGYMWGKNTRPLDQQRWTKPYWRGSDEEGVILHDHYEVRSMPNIKDQLRKGGA